MDIRVDPDPAAPRGGVIDADGTVYAAAGSSEYPVATVFCDPAEEDRWGAMFACPPGHRGREMFGFRTRLEAGQWAVRRFAEWRASGHDPAAEITAGVRPAGGA